MIGTQKRFVNLSKTLAFLMCFGAGTSVWAADLSYSYVEVDYIVEVEQDFGDGDKLDGDGFGVSGSFELGDLFFVSGSFQDATISETYLGQRYSADIEIIRAGLGLHGGITESLDWLVSADYARLEAKDDFFGTTKDSGYIVDLGIRGLVADSFEYSAAIVQSDVGGSETGFRVGGRYHFAESGFSLGADYVSYSDDFYVIETGLRYQF